jgi:NodT family efflux transporter outer membrane factor (OMF) lipoprotein
MAEDILLKHSFFRLLRGLVIFIALPAFTGCNPHEVNKDVSPLVEGNNAYSLSEEGIAPQKRWWEAFNDRLLDDAVAQALSQNLTLMQARARIAQAIAADRQAASFLYPELSGKASGEGQWTDEDEYEDTFDAGVELSWEVDLWGRLSSANSAAEYELLASREDLESTALLLVSRVAETYFQIIEQNLQLKLLESQIISGATLLELTELRFAYGEASVVDVFQQRQQLASTRSQVPVAQSRLRTLENSLHVQLGRAPVSTPLMMADIFPELPGLPATGIPVDLLKNRPDLRRIYSQLVAFDYRVAEAVADRFPRVDLTGTAKFRDRIGTEGLLFSLLLDAAAPIIDWDRRLSEVQKREAILKEELARYSLAYLTAIEEVENALWQEQYLKELLKARENQISIARANLTASGNRYRQGLTDYLPVLAALQSLQELERDIITRQRELISVRILLYRALGGSPVNSEQYSTDWSAEDQTAYISERVVK